MPFTTITVSIPEGKEAELLSFAASLAAATTETPADPSAEEDVAPNGSQRRWGWGRRAVHDAYLGGVSVVWRPFLEYLADRPDQWVPWPELCQHISRTPRQASGVLGAAERRCHGRPPYEKRQEGDAHFFRMPAHVAEFINEVRDDEE